MPISVLGVVHLGLRVVVSALVLGCPSDLLPC